MILARRCALRRSAVPTRGACITECLSIPSPCIPSVLPRGRCLAPAMGTLPNSWDSQTPNRRELTKKAFGWQGIHSGHQTRRVLMGGLARPMGQPTGSCPSFGGMESRVGGPVGVYEAMTTPVSVATLEPYFIVIGIVPEPKSRLPSPSTTG